MAQQVMSSLMTEDRLPRVVLYLDTCAVVQAHTQPHQIRTKAVNKGFKHGGDRLCLSLVDPVFYSVIPSGHSVYISMME